MWYWVDKPGPLLPLRRCERQDAGCLFVEIIAAGATSELATTRADRQNAGSHDSSALDIDIEKSEFRHLHYEQQLLDTGYVIPI